MSTEGLALFETAIGACGIVWSTGGIVGVQLSEADGARTRARMMRRFPTAVEAPPPAKIGRAIDGIVALLAGQPSDLWSVVLDMDGVPAFERRVYAIARTIPPGATTTYGEIAARLGDAGAARAVGRALGRNPFAIVVPCHRVLGANGRAGGFSASGGALTKMRLLTIERAHTGAEPSLFADLPLVVRPRGRA
jgi:methylated-DNA-[protein]-cysteine S-methyltransferase